VGGDFDSMDSHHTVRLASCEMIHQKRMPDQDNPHTILSKPLVTDLGDSLLGTMNEEICNVEQLVNPCEKMKAGRDQRRWSERIQN